MDADDSVNDCSGDDESERQLCNDSSPYIEPARDARPEAEAQDSDNYQTGHSPMIINNYIPTHPSQSGSNLSRQLIFAAAFSQYTWTAG